MAGDWTSQKFLGSMEGAVLAGKLAAEIIVDRVAGKPMSVEIKEIQPDVIARAASYTPKDPLGIPGDNTFSYGGGAVLGKDFAIKQIEDVMNN